MGQYSDDPMGYCSMIWAKNSDQIDNNQWVQEDGGGQIEQPEQVEAASNPDYEKESENLKRWLPEALAGGAKARSFAEHPIAGDAIRNSASEIGRRLMSKCGESLRKDADIDDGSSAEEVGMAILDAIEEMIEESNDDKIKKAWPQVVGRMIAPYIKPALKGAVAGALGGAREAQAKQGSWKDQWEQAKLPMNKSVAEQIGSKFSPKQRKAKYDFGGESEISGDGTKMDVDSIIGTSKKEESA